MTLDFDIEKIIKYVITDNNQENYPTVQEYFEKRKIIKLKKNSNPYLNFDSNNITY